MKKSLLTFGLALAVGQLSAQFVNNSSIYVGEGALVSFGTEVVNNGSITNNGSIELRNNLENNSVLNSSGKITLSSGAGLTISGNRVVEAGQIDVQGDVLLRNSLKVGKSLNFASGNIYTEGPAVLEFGPSSSYSNLSDFSHVVGTVKKEGNGSFTFPLGDGSRVKSFEVADLGGRALEANYFADNTLDKSSELDYDVEEVNSFEYWTVKNGSSNGNLAVNLGGSKVASLKGGVWSINKKGVNVENGLATFTSGKDKGLVKDIGVWPNPTSGEFNLKLSGMKDSDEILVDITNQDGRIIRSLKGKVSELRKAYQLPGGLVATSLVVRVVNGDEVLTQNLILHK